MVEGFERKRKKEMKFMKRGKEEEI